MENKVVKKILTWLFLIVSMLLAIQIGKWIPLLGSAISAIFIGFAVRHTSLFDMLDNGVTKFATKYMLKAGIVLLGFTLSLKIIGQVGTEVLIVLAGEIIVSILIGIIAGKLLGVGNKLSLLLGIGTSICGGSAIVASSPVIEAEDDEVAVSITTMFIYSVVALFLLPVIGRALGYNDNLYGILAGAAVNDTASVVATAQAWSDEALKIGTVVKLVRTLFIVPVTVGVIAYKVKNTPSSKENGGIDFKKIVSLVPLFVVLFVLAVVFATFVDISQPTIKLIKTTSSYLMTLALVTIGLGVHIKDIKNAGIKPVILGGLCWFGVLAATIGLMLVLY
ncbi:MULTISPECIES: YeiH family protein [Helcococcus]|uniref:Sulfate exporter family transporter n=1 Tax=Helcococcus bovis TaxID=3153252 RepID=A0ABW9F736_9FIRM